MSSFKPNPLSLSVPDPALDRWLRDSGYLNLLDSSASTPTTASSSAAAPANPASASAAAAADVLAIARTLASVLALNPFARLSAADLAAPTPPWSLAFLGPPGAASYSWPPTPTQARLRVQENVRRYARNYAALAIVVFACCLYRMPMALLGMLAILVVWEGVRYCRERWGLASREPRVGQFLLHCAQIVMMLHACFRKLTPPNLPDPGKRNRRAQLERS
ncbi:PRA1 family protein H isoform X4 [Oryza brachyantha]|uniref:PRA1 family protein H isoform X4 n=1 Tax=Oryza brachyantha TaxID=4533 RepID=UPI001ADA2EBB|nr:PRA1 family protein H isoform X4 [Oryza brachyantha]